jgi:putative peptidoglycan lipid II flippase
VASVLGYLPGFLIPLATAAIYGASAETDVFFLALALASLIAGSLGATTQQAAIPFLVAARRSTRDIGVFMAEMTVGLLSLAVVVILIAGAGVIAYVGQRAQWDASARRLLIQTLILFVPYVLCSVIAGIYSGALNAAHVYTPVAVSPAMRSVIVLVSLLLTPFVGIKALAVGYIAGEGARLAYLLAGVRRLYPVRFWAWPRSPLLYRFARSGLPQLAGSGIVAFVPVMDRMMAARLSAGNISLLDYADRLWQVPIGLALSGFMVTSLAYWTERIHSGGTVRLLGRDTARVAAGLFGVFAGCAVLFVAVRRPAIIPVFALSKLSTGEVNLLATTLTMLVVSAPFHVAALVYTRAFLILHRSDLLLLVAIFQLAIKAVGNAWLIGAYGIVGIAAATAIAACASALLLVGLFHLRTYDLPGSGIETSKEPRAQEAL